MSDQYPQHPQDPAAQGQPSYGQPTYGQQPYQQPSSQPQGTYRQAPATMSPEDERTWGAISHAGAVVAMICSAGFLGFLASIAVYVIQKDRGPFVRAHAANSINVQISMFIWLVVAAVIYVVLGIVTLGIGFVVFLPVFAVPLVVAGVLHVIGAVKAYNGEWWNPPFTPQLVK
ncbi:DUF4870 domain-containing protein [Nocardioides renjunii]|uniref:DUF4870 domain-containing protein n=1 Tax=Nocardioides renjunii TaxID=3095075 RepID=UPI002AFDF1FB|nr:DUF4870 domain-containing protein [Nocardioides sp. S-34]WQQ23742.1 DUF4870 domain-containing protein [Nocardioides sp. S-34]